MHMALTQFNTGTAEGGGCVTGAAFISSKEKQHATTGKQKIRVRPKPERNPKLRRNLQEQKTIERGGGVTSYS